MKCEYCEKEISIDKEYCDFCGAKNINYKALSKNEKPKNAKKNKKKKIVLIVLFVILILTGILMGSVYWICSLLDDAVSDFGYSYSDEFDSDTFDFGSDSFDFWTGDHNYSYDDEYGKTEYEYADKFISGTIDSSTNTYTSEFSGLNFQFPTNWTVYTEDELNEAYFGDSLSSSTYDNLFVCDVYATDSFTDASFYVAYYNADYYDEYEDIDDFNTSIKEYYQNYNNNAYDVDYAEDSTLTIDGEKYNQLAARLTSDGSVCYIYDFTRYVDGYYIEINACTYDIDTMGKIIDFLNDK